MMLPIKFMQMAYNKTKRSQKAIYLVIHDTGNTSKGADALANWKYFNGGNRGSSADFFVDDHQIIQGNDYTKYYTWHCGDKLPNPGPFYGIAGNFNSIGIEICINQDGNYNKAWQNTVELVQYLMGLLNIPIDRVIRHNDVSGKICPKTMSSNNWALWKKFKEAVMNNNEEVLNMTQYEELKRMIEDQNAKIASLEGAISAVADYAGIKYNYIDDYLPNWAHPVIEKLVKMGALKGDENGLGLSQSDIKLLTILDRVNVIDNSILYNDIKDIPDWGKDTVCKLVNAGIIKGDENGNLGITIQTVKLLVYLDRANYLQLN